MSLGVAGAVKRWFRVQSIGVVRRSDRQQDPDDFFDPAAVSILEIDPRWEAGLDGLEEFSHLVVMWYLDRVARRRTVGKPRAAENIPEAKLVGFFATRTPRRPNPIGIGCPRLLRREGTQLHVTGLDAWDGSPILDIKGYYPRDELRIDATVPDWLTNLWWKHDAERRADTPPAPDIETRTSAARTETAS